MMMLNKLFINTMCDMSGGDSCCPLEDYSNYDILSSKWCLRVHYPGSSSMVRETFEHPCMNPHNFTLEGLFKLCDIKQSWHYPELGMLSGYKKSCDINRIYINRVVWISYITYFFTVFFLFALFFCCFLYKTSICWCPKESCEFSSSKEKTH